MAQSKLEPLRSFGTEIRSSVLPTVQLLSPLLIKNASNILSTTKETCQYGRQPRQYLDVYSPQKVSSTAPILLFFYLGGFVSGDRILVTAPEGLVYANVGHFFAERGLVTIIPDYHLLYHEAKFPSGGEDVAAVVSWAKERYSGQGPRDLFMLGNSSGGVHVATFMLSQLFQAARLSIDSCSGLESGLKWKGTVLLAPPYHYHGLSEDQQSKPREYYEDKVEEHCVMGLLKSYQGEELERNLPPVLAAWSTLDPEDEIVDSNCEFVKEWRERGMPGLETMCFEGHNHISPTWSLGTKDQECEAWAEQVIEWMLHKQS